MDASSNNPSPKILMVGAGAVGGFYGGKLAQAGARVAVVCRSDFQAVKERGIAISSIRGDFLFKPEKVLARAGDYPGRPDFLIVSLKVLPDIDVAAQIKDAVGPETAIVLLQNGVEIEPPVARVFPDNEIISGLAFVCVSRTAPGKVEHIDFGSLTIGRYPAGRSAKVELLASLFDRAGVPCSISEDAIASRWLKLVWNAPFSPLSVLGRGADTGRIMRIEECALLAKVVMKEVCSIAEADGHPVPREAVQKNLEATRVMKPCRTSMLLDFEHGRPMETEAILGNALAAAKRHGLSTPHLETLYALMKLVEQR